MLFIAILRTIAYIWIGIQLVGFAIEQYAKQKEVARLEGIRDQLEAAYEEQKLLNRVA